MELILVLQFHTGTSTGALIAYALVGGKDPEENETQRSKMSLKEILHMYEQQIPKIFYTWRKGKRYAMRLNPRSQKPLKKALMATFGEETLTSCINLHGRQVFAGAVAKPTDPTGPSEIFDGSVQAEAQKVQEVLAASCDAPFYFKTPTNIGQRKFHDGGVGGTSYFLLLH